VGDDQRLRRLEPLRQFRDDLLLVRSVHTSPSSLRNENARTEAGTEKTSSFAYRLDWTSAPSLLLGAASCLRRTGFLQASRSRRPPVPPRRCRASASGRRGCRDPWSSSA